MLAALASFLQMEHREVNEIRIRRVDSFLESELVLAACHSLVRHNGRLAGDPMEKAAIPKATSPKKTDEWPCPMKSSR